MSSSQTPWHSNQGDVPDGQQHPGIQHRFLQGLLEPNISYLWQWPNRLSLRALLPRVTLLLPPRKGVSKGFIRSPLWPLTNLSMQQYGCFFVPSPMVAIFWNCSVKQHTVYIQNSEFLVASLRTSPLDVPKNSLRKKHQNRGAQTSQQGIIAANYSVVLARRI